MAKNKIITSVGSVQFIWGDKSNRNITVNPNFVYTSVFEDTISFTLVGLPRQTGLALFTTRFEDVELNGTSYPSIEALQEAVADAFSKAGSSVRFEIVDELPTEGDPNAFYLLRIQNPELGNAFEEYIWVDDDWELVGSMGGSSIKTIYVGCPNDSVDPTTGVITKNECEKKDQLCIVYQDDQGMFSMTKVDLDEFILNNEFADGLYVDSGGTVHGKVDERQPSIVTRWNDDGTSASTQVGLSVGESGFTLNYVQEAINAKHGNTIKLNGFTSGLTEDLFSITSGDTITQAFMKIENKLYKDEDNGLIFDENSDDVVILDGGTF